MIRYSLGMTFTEEKKTLIGCSKLFAKFGSKPAVGHCQKLTKNAILEQARATF